MTICRAEHGKLAKRFGEYAALWQRVAERPVDDKFFKSGSRARARARTRASTWRRAAVAVLTQDQQIDQARDAISAFLASITADSDNYIGGIERLQLEDALQALSG